MVTLGYIGEYRGTGVPGPLPVWTVVWPHREWAVSYQRGNCEFKETDRMEYPETYQKSFVKNKEGLKTVISRHDATHQFYTKNRVIIQPASLDNLNVGTFLLPLRFQRNQLPSDGSISFVRSPGTETLGAFSIMRVSANVSGFLLPAEACTPHLTPTL